ATLLAEKAERHQQRRRRQRRCGSGGQTRFEGQDYDFVFTVDVERRQAASEAALQSHRRSLVRCSKFMTSTCCRRPTWIRWAQFIRTNAGETPTISQGTYAGFPYTGSGRYIPGSGTSDGGTGGGFSDPLSPVQPILSAGNMAGLRKNLANWPPRCQPDLPDRLVRTGGIRDQRPSHQPCATCPSWCSSRPSARSPQLTGCSNCCHRHAGQSWLGTERPSPHFSWLCRLETCLLTRPGIKLFGAKDLGFEAAAAARFT
uniref:T-box transcription factor tbx20 n=1 Tax=Macrostomum lignano TaxID=282301 RepID=A0A1I8FN87_9PLAT